MGFSLDIYRRLVWVQIRSQMQYRASFLINLAAAEGHPSSVMDMSFANQALSIEFMMKNKKPLAKQVYPVPKKIDNQIAKEKLAAMGTKIDRLTPEQKKYLASWDIGT